MPDDTIELLDRLRIRELEERYFYSIDQNDYELLVSCFASDAKTHYASTNTYTVGTDDLKEMPQVGKMFTFMSHHLSSLSIDLRGDVASADVRAVAFLGHGPLVGGTVIVRGVQYLDELDRGEDGWRIIERKNRPLWQYVATTVEPLLPTWAMK